MRLLILVGLALAATLTACGSVAAPITHPNAVAAAKTVPGPPSGTRAEATALARQLLSRLGLPPGARRLPQTPLPKSLITPAMGPAAATPSLDQYELFALGQSMPAAAAFLATHAPAGLGDGGTGSGSGPGGVMWQEVTYTDHQVPAGISFTQVVLTVVPASTGGSLLRADAQVIWYPPRSAAEYIDPARYHVLRITVSIAGAKPHTVRKVVTSQAFIARLATALDEMQAEPDETWSCPAIFADYQLSFSVSRASRPAVVVSANETGCGGAGLSVNGRQQPALVDQGGTVAALVDRVVSVTWRL